MTSKDILKKKVFSQSVQKELALNFGTYSYVLSFNPSPYPFIDYQQFKGTLVSIVPASMTFDQMLTAIYRQLGNSGGWRLVDIKQEFVF